MIGTNRYIGSPVERIEDLRFLRGRGKFVGDLKREGMLHAAILRSPIAHGLIASLDASAALAIRGVRAGRHYGERHRGRAAHPAASSTVAGHGALFGPAFD
jgi:CO/xanthine dehydrogenase Mo-binding subunit